MSQFYTLVMRRKQIVTRYDTKGQLIDRQETFIDETHSGLPAATVAGYRKKFPDAIIQVTAETVDRSPMRVSSSRSTERDYKPLRRKLGSEGEKPATPAATHVGTYGELVDRMAERERRS